MAKNSINLLVGSEFDAKGINKAKKELAQLESQITPMAAKFTALGTSMSSVGKKMTMGLTLPIVAIGAAATKMFMDFDSSMTKITSLVGISKDEVDKMRASVLQLSGQTAKSPQELADALFVVTSAGLRGTAAIDALTASAKASASGLGETADIARAVAGSVNAYGEANLSAAKATDIIVATARAGNFETSQFAAALGRVLPFAKQAGASLEEVGGAVALLTRTNGDAAQSVTQVSALMRAFVVPTEEAKKALGAAGLSASDMRDRISKDGLASALQFLDKTLGGNREQLGKLLGSSEAAGAAFQILDADSQTLSATFGDVADSVNINNEAFETTSESSAFKFAQAMTQIKTSLIDFGAIIAPLVNTVASGFGAMANAVGSLPGPVKTLVVGFGLLLAAIGPVLFVVGKTLMAFGTLAAAATTVSARFVTAFAAMKASLIPFTIQVKSAMIVAKTQLGALALGAKAAAAFVVTSLRSIGVALKGMLVSFGPIGLALIGLTVAFEVFSNRSQEATERLDEFKNAMSQIGDAATVAALELVIRDIQALNTVLSFTNARTGQQLLDELGMSVADVAVKTIGAEADFNALVDTLDAAGMSNSELKLSTDELVQSIMNSRSAFLQANGDLAAAAEATDETAVAAKLLGLDVSSLGDEMAGAAGDAAGLQTEVKKLSDIFTVMDANVAAIRAKDEFTKFIKGMDDALAENNRKLLGNSKAAMENRNAVLDAFDKGKQDAIAWGEANGATLAQVESRFKSNTETLRTELIKQGFKKKDIEKFFGSEFVDAAGVGVEARMKTSIGTLADRLGPVALREFKGVGSNMTSGLVAGISSGIPPMERKMSAAILAAKAAAQDTAEIKSPSKVFERIGNQLMAGLEKGIDEKSEAVAEKAKKAIDDAISAAQDSMQAFDDYRQSVSDSLIGLLSLGDAYENYTKRQQAVTTTLAELMQYQATVQGETTDEQKAKLAELQGAYQKAQGDAANGAQSIIDEFIDQGVRLAEFNSNMQKLLAAGLSRTAFDAIMSESGSRGADIAAALAQGNIAENARRVSQVYTSVQAMGAETAQQAASTFMATGVKLATDLLGELIKEFMPAGKKRKQLMAALKNLNDSIKFEPKFIDIVTRYSTENPPAASAPSGSFGGFTNDELTEAMAGYTGPIFPPGFEFDFSGIGGLPQFADGGIATKPTLGIFGEAGPEALVPLSRGGNSMLAGNTYNVTINTGIGDPRVIGEEVVNVISKFEKANGAVFARA